MKPKILDEALHRRNLIFLIVSFALTRLLAYALGVRPLTSETTWFMQFLDLDLLKNHLARSLIHLHGQPPLLNALVGICEKVAGSHYGDLICIFYVCLGLLSASSVYVSLVLLRVSSTLSLVVGLILTLNPMEVLSEFDPIYTVPVIAIHSFMAVALISYLRWRSSRTLFAFMGLAVILTLTRSPYQWIWVVALVVTLFWQLRENRRQIITAGGVGVVLSLLWPIKNEILFHHFTSTTWGSLSIAKHWDWNGSAEQQLVRRGLISTFAPPDNSDEAVARLLRNKWQRSPTGYPELDDVTKKTGGALNWNSIAGLRLNDARQSDVRRLLRYEPGEFFVNLLHSVAIYFYPTSQYYVMFGDDSGRFGELTDHYRPLKSIDMAVRRVCCNVFGLPPDTSLMSPAEAAHVTAHHSLMSISKKTCVGALLVNGILLVCIASFGRTTVWKSGSNRRVAAMVMTVTMTYSFLVNLVEFGENERYRFETQALVFMVVAIFLQQLWDRRLLRAKRGAKERSIMETYS